MSTIKSSDEHLTLNADGSSKDIKFQANGVEKASISSSGAFTSTTIDATKLTGNLPAISGASLTGLTSAQMPTGSVLQVVQGTTNTQVAATGTASTNLSASITPSSTSSKILVLFSQKYYTATTSIYIGMHLYRDAGAIKNWNNTLMGLNHSAYATFQYLDSPSSTSSETYEVYMSISDGSGTIYANANSAPAEITLMEIAG